MMLQPALKRQKVLIFIFLAVVLIMVLGAWKIRTSLQHISVSEVANPTQSQPPTSPPKAETIPLVLTKKSSSTAEGTETFSVAIDSKGKKISAVTLRLIFTDSEINNAKYSFKMNTQFKSAGWQMAINTKSAQSDLNRSSFDIALLNAQPNAGEPLTPSVVIGELTAPQKARFSIDSAVSTAATTDGTRLELQLKP